MIKVVLKNNEIIKLELGDEKKELDLVTRFHHGFPGDTALNLKTGRNEVRTRIPVSDIKNIQYVKSDARDSADPPEGSRFKSREEYEAWKERKLKGNEMQPSKKGTAKKTGR